MKLYNSFEKDFLRILVTVPKCLTYVLIVLNVSLLIGSLFKFVLIYVSIGSGMLNLIAAFIYICNRRIYGRKVHIEGKVLQTFDVNGKCLFSSSINNIRIEKKDVMYNGPGKGATVKKSLIIYNSNGEFEQIEETEPIEYRSYCKEKNILFAENPELISIIEKMIDDKTIFVEY